jgi:hypothetical protein
MGDLAPPTRSRLHDSRSFEGVISLHDVSNCIPGIRTLTVTPDGDVRPRTSVTCEVLGRSDPLPNHSTT